MRGTGKGTQTKRQNKVFFKMPPRQWTSAMLCPVVAEAAHSRMLAE